MATNVYFSQKHRPEQNLYEDIVIESLQMYGQDVYYLPRDIVSRDSILNEAIESEFNEAYMIEMYIENTTGFEGDSELISKFGLEIRDQATFIVSRRRYNQLVGFNNNLVSTDRPVEGDLIYYPMTKSLFEIKFVEHEAPFYQLSNLPVYKLQCELFEYSMEKINTDITDLQSQIDSIQPGIMVTVQKGTGIFKVGETVIQELETANSGKNIYGVVSSVTEVYGGYNVEIKEIYTDTGEYGSFRTTDEGWEVLKSDSAQLKVTEVYEIDNTTQDGTFMNENFAQNRDMELAGDLIIDFTENNPFGDPGEV